MDDDIWQEEMRKERCSSPSIEDEDMDEDMNEDGGLGDLVP